MIFEDRILRNPRLLRLKNPTTQEVIDWEIQDLEQDEILQEGTEVTATILNQIQTDFDDTKLNKTVVTDAYSSSSTYSVGDYCIYGNTLYKCTTAISTAEEFDSSKWEEVNVMTTVRSLIENILLESDKKKYHVGKIIIETDNRNPATYLGFGTWQYWGSGRVPVGVDTSQTEFNTVEKTGGEKTHQLTVDEMPSHSHQAKNKYLVNGDAGTACALPSNDGVSTTDNWTEISQTGGGQPHNNLQPYITCYMWKRTA